MDNVVIFCGAGFSAPFGIPVMSSFSDRLRAAGHLGDRQSDFDAIQLQCDALGAFIGGSARNLEQLASFLSMLKITRPNFLFPGCKRTPGAAMTLLLEAVRRMVTPDLPGQTVQSSTQDLFGAKTSLNSARLSVITTNYDLVVEFAAMSHQRPVTPTRDVLLACATPLNDASIYHSPQANSVGLFKLHGSVNWLAKPPNNELHVSNRYEIDCAPPRSDTWRTELLDPGKDRDWLMVPPSVLKPDMMALLRSQWQGASDAIASADVLWFIGYSFPETDSFMRYFLASSLFTNVRLRQLVVIDPSREVGLRAKALFKMPSLEDVFWTIPLAWGQVPFPALYEGQWDTLRPAINPEAISFSEQVTRVLRGRPLS